MSFWDKLDRSTTATIQLLIIVGEKKENAQTPASARLNDCWMRMVQLAVCPATLLGSFTTYICCIKCFGTRSPVPFRLCRHPFRFSTIHSGLGFLVPCLVPLRTGRTTSIPIRISLCSFNQNHFYSPAPAATLNTSPTTPCHRT